MKTTLYLSLCFGISLALLSVSCESPFEATTDIGKQVADEIDSSIADYSTNYAIVANVASVDSAFSRRDSSSRESKVITVGTRGSETAYGYFEFDTTLLLGRQARHGNGFNVTLRLFLVPAEEESLANASEVSLPVYRYPAKDSGTLVDPEVLAGQTPLDTFVLTLDADKGTLLPDSQLLSLIPYTVKDTVTNKDNIRIDTLATGRFLIADTTTDTVGEELPADTVALVDSTVLSVLPLDAEDGNNIIKRRTFLTRVETRRHDGTTYVDTITLDSLVVDTVRIDTLDRQTLVRLDSLGLCITQPDSAIPLLRLQQPYIEVEYRTVRDTTKKQTKVLSPNYAGYSVLESNAAHRDTLPVSSWAPARYTVLTLDLADYWSALDSSLEGSASPRVVSSILGLPLSIASDFIPESDSSLVLSYVLTEKETLPADDRLHLGGVGQLDNTRTSILLNVTDDMRDLYQHKTRPVHVRLFLRIEDVRVTPSGWQTDNQWRVVNWNIGEGGALEIETAFAATD